MGLNTAIATRVNGTPPPEVPIADIELGSLDFWALDDDVRDGAFATLRREAPISFWPTIELPGFVAGNGHWALTKYDDVFYASRHPDIFSSYPNITINDQTPELAEYFGSMIVLDDPRHQRLRSIVSRAFTPKVVARIEAAVRDRAHRLVVDDRHTGPTGYECLAPHHFLLTEWFAPYVEFLVSKHRAMDNMDLSLHHPQEDEFVWCMQGLPSPYLTIAFPNRPPQYEEYLDLEQVAPRELEIWKRTLFRFVQQVYFRRRKTVILKNPTHSFRIKVLLEVFPQAKFIHIVRDPYVVYPSTIHLHKALYRIHGLQQPTFDGLDDKVVSTYVDLYRKLDEGRELVDPTRFYELRYEDLIGDPEGQLRRLYQHLGLGDFECYLPRLRQYLADHADYKTNSYQLTVEQRAIVDEHWGEIIDRYGYDRHTPEPARLRPAVGG